MKLKLDVLSVLMGAVVACSGYAAEPIPEREWTSDAGTTLQASVEKLDGDDVVFKSADGKEIRVPLARLVPGDQEVINEHFAVEAEPEAEEKPDDGAEKSQRSGREKGELLGEVKEDLPGGDIGTVSAYIPSSHKEGTKVPVLCYVDKAKATAKDFERFAAGAEVTGWLVSVSSEMSGKMLEEVVDSIGNGWKKCLEESLPVNPDQIYGASYSSGIKGLLQISKHMGGYQGMLIVEGYFPKSETGIPITYTMAGLDSTSRINVSKSFNEKSPRGSLLRMTELGKGNVSDEEFEDGMIFLAINYYTGDGARETEQVIGFVERLLARAEDVGAGDPERAYMWLMQMADIKQTEEQTAKWTELSTKFGDEKAKLYYEGFEELQDLAVDEIAEAESSKDEKANKKIAKEVEKMLEKYEGTKWIDVLESVDLDK